MLASVSLFLSGCDSRPAELRATNGAHSKTDHESTDSQEDLSGREVVQLSVDTIRIELDDDSPSYRLPEIDHQFDHEGIVKFLTDFYGSLEDTDSKPDVLVGPTPKRLLAGEPEFFDAMKSLSEKHGFSIVRMPPMAGDDPHRLLRRFAEEHSPE